MIQANELRIGNWIRYSGHIVQVSEFRKGGHVKTLPPLDGYLSEYDGVELTPEILEKCGFKWEGGRRKGWYAPMVNDWKFRIWQDDEHDFIWSINDFNAINLFHLHQLQNLYFALTGEELTVNL